MARRVAENLAVASAVHERRQPADFEVRATLDEHVRLVQHPNKTRPRIDEVRVFRTLGNGSDFHFVSADVFGDGTKVRQRCDDVERRSGREHDSKETESGKKPFHISWKCNG